ncbi:hypothetical protein KC19_3G018700 [Ceratodon purpureus]|uniref:U6 small nuclear RNA (adenine-(43)-N(6))-methyltransferase n=1 Tax=Ceratodon purpureus TaxID=3225 RepID=A0A8T0IHH3_CERPU|nr:hypothetical protein KC19_3G018700 [Ceratodon purpureus]
MERKMHPRNKYAEKPPDFTLLAGLYPEFKQYVSYGFNQKPRIDWTDFNATRELTRSLLHHDYGISWWIPDGQLCPAVTNRANYIHWIEDLLALSPAPWHSSGEHLVSGVDIGTGANCIYPLLGVSLHGWRFVGTDITPVALEWAKWNVESNPHVSALIEIRSAILNGDTSVDDKNIDISSYDVIGPALPPQKQELVVEEPQDPDPHSKELVTDFPYIGPALPPQKQELMVEDLQDPDPRSKELVTDSPYIGPQGPAEIDRSSECSSDEEPSELAVPPRNSSDDTNQSSGVLVGVLRDEERFDFCMCNPPFFASMEEAGLNPRTACGGTAAEMVCSGGEEAFVARIIEDSAQLKHVIHWFTTMVGRKVTLKGLSAKLWALGAATVRTTEFVQGRTSRWGLAWSFTPPAAVKKNPVLNKSNHSFMLEGLGRGCTAVDMLQVLATQLQSLGALCTVSVPDFSISGFLPDDVDACEAVDVLGKRKRETVDETRPKVVISSNNTREDNSRSFKAWVFQQAPGSLLVKASLSKGSEYGGTFADLFERVEQSLKQRFQFRSQK